MRRRRRPSQTRFSFLFACAAYPTRPRVGTTTLRGMNSFGQWLSDSDYGARRAGIFNLTARLRALDAALDAEKPLS